MLFKNKLTGVTWDIQNDEHIKRCSKDSDYEKVEKKKVEPVKDDSKKEQPKKQTKSTTSKKKSTTKK